MSLVVAPPEARAIPLFQTHFPRHAAGRVWCALLALCGSLFFYGLSAGDFYRTESLRALIAGEMLRGGGWLVPTLHGEPLLTKPPGAYAAVALASWPAGAVSERTARLPSAVAATLTVLLFYWYFRRQLGRPGGLVAATVLPLSVLWLDKVPSAEIDMLHVFWVTAAVLCFLRALEAAEEARGGGCVALRCVALRCARADAFSPRGPLNATQRTRGGSPFRPWLWWAAALVCVVAGVLTKWTAPVFFYGTAVPLLWRRGRLRLLWGRHHLAAAALALGLCLLWAGAVVARAGWDAFAGTVGREALMRLSPAHHHRPYPWREVLAHPFWLLALNLPWSAFALLTLRRGFADLWDERGRRLLQALHCWAWPSLLFWSLVPDHAPRHSFPLFPGLAGLAALVWTAWLTGKLRWPLRRLTARQTLLGLLALWLFGKLVFVHAVVPVRNHNRQPHAKGEQLAALVPAGQTLYLVRPKDDGMEGIVFYYTRSAPAPRPVRRVSSAELLPSGDELLYCIVDEADWRRWDGRPAEPLVWLGDEVGGQIVLLRVGATTDGERRALRPPCGTASLPPG